VGLSGTLIRTTRPARLNKQRRKHLLAADVPKSVLALIIATQRPIDLAALNELFSCPLIAALQIECYQC
jgi:hypothetical protein